MPPAATETTSACPTISALMSWCNHTYSPEAAAPIQTGSPEDVLLFVVGNVSTGSASSLVTLGKGTNGAVSYCCGTPVSNGSDVVCRDGNSVQVTDGEIIAGYAALANVSSLDGGNSSVPTASSTASANPSTQSSHEVAIGVGVGVPLGVIALASIIWAMWERRMRMRHAGGARH
ncbi:uncharacterized protein CDV56_108927 [Aspergillus thermomutatus]|uniref:Uncharacterized protein n=1 Tax=Aspergillus thermomutatus TaxID=41047 RepID=A0A397HKK8_ASPTH|nr:uncharacterized protein CDV56_108927 [Aspergillus thermomutatus]RHZ63625.1 hypothetical protein CDV56_108927 [Aspergillus thermomutatus]